MKNVHVLDRIGSDNAVQRGIINKALMDVLDGLMKGERDLKEASEISNAAGKVLKSHAVDLAEALFIGWKPGGSTLELTNG